MEQVVYSCDRCGKDYYRGLKHRGRRIKYGVDITRFNEWNQYDIQLCEDCIKDLQMWFFKDRSKRTPERIEYEFDPDQISYRIEDGEEYTPEKPDEPDKKWVQRYKEITGPLLTAVEWPTDNTETDTNPED